MKYLESVSRPSENKKAGLLLAGSIALATLVPSGVKELTDLRRERTANSVNYCLHNTNADACEILISKDLRSSLDKIGCKCGNDDLEALTDGVNLACRTKNETMKIPAFLPQTKCGPITKIPRINL